MFGLGAKAGHALVVHPDVPLISFTGQRLGAPWSEYHSRSIGGTATGELVIKASAPFYKRLSLELGGKNPNIIFADADLAECVATSVRSSFSNQGAVSVSYFVLSAKIGEICLCGSRIYVQQAVYDRFLAVRLTVLKDSYVNNSSFWKQLQNGGWVTLATLTLVRACFTSELIIASVVVGALISADHLAKVSGFVRTAREEGAKVLLGGERVEVPKGFEGGYWMAPTVIADVSPASSLQTDEIFGPVVTISKVGAVDPCIG